LTNKILLLLLCNLYLFSVHRFATPRSNVIFWPAVWWDISVRACFAYLFCGPSYSNSCRMQFSIQRTHRNWYWHVWQVFGVTDRWLDWSVAR